MDCVFILLFFPSVSSSNSEKYEKIRVIGFIPLIKLPNFIVLMITKFGKYALESFVDLTYKFYESNNAILSKDITQANLLFE